MINLTPHDIVIFDHEGNEKVTIPASGTVARVSQTQSFADTIEAGGWPVDIVEVVDGEIEGLEELGSVDAYFLVSNIVAQAAKKKSLPISYRLLIPTDLVRDEGGRVIGCTKFARVT